MLGVEAALKEEGALDNLCGKIKLCVVPAEEGIEIGYRKGLIDKGQIEFTSGKPEFISRRYFDDVDIAFMMHSSSNDDEKINFVLTKQSSIFAKENKQRKYQLRNDKYKDSPMSK
jgi:metal-dependent amidase/aminoacylase/carboxypeptidase family protein